MLGLDGADFYFINHYVKKDKLPIFKKVIENGVFSELLSTIPCNTIPALPTLYTGKNPGNTGVFDFFDKEGNVIAPANIEFKTLWHYLTEKKRKIIISNLSFTYPPERINGIMICNLHDKLLRAWLEAWEDKVHYWVYPRSFQSELNGWTISNEKFRDLIVNKLLNGDRIGFENLKRLTLFRFSKFKQLYLKGNFDFGFHWINGTDTISHFSLMNKKQILEFYNECIEPVLEECVEDFNDHNLLLISDHGSCAQLTHKIYLNYVLQKHGYLRMKNAFFSEISPHFNELTDYIPKTIYNTLIRLFKTIKIKMKFSRTLKDNSITFERYGRGIIYGINRKGSIAYSDISWGIKLNKNNIKNYDKVRSNLIKTLKELQDANGANILQSVWKKEEIFQGKYLDKLPDIIILPKKNYIPDKSMKKRYIQRIRNPEIIGKHHWSRSGIFIAYGPDFKKNFKSKSSYQLVDLMPTIIFLLNFRVPNELDGRVLKEIISEESNLFDKQVKYSNENIKRTKMIRGLTESEEKIIKAKLEALGYI